MKKQLLRRIVLDTVMFGYLLTIAVAAVMRPTERELLANASKALFVVLGCGGLGFLLSVALERAGVRTLGTAVFGRLDHAPDSRPRPWYLTFWGVQLLITFVVTVVVGVIQTEASIYELTDEAGFAGAMRLFGGIFSPNFDILPQAILAVIETIFIAFMATVIAIPVAFVLSFTAAKNIMDKHPVSFGAYGVIRTTLNVVRSIEPLIWAIIFSVWVGIGPFAGMLALMLHSVASLAKLYSESIEDIDEGLVEAVTSTGASYIQVIRFAVVPQIVIPYISFSIYRWDINVRMATIIGLVGGGGIGNLLIQYQGQALWHEVGCIVVVIAAVVWLMDVSSAYIREAIK